MKEVRAHLDIVSDISLYESEDSRPQEVCMNGTASKPLKSSVDVGKQEILTEHLHKAIRSF